MACGRHFCGVSLRLVSMSAIFFATLVSKSARALYRLTLHYSPAVSRNRALTYTQRLSHEPRWPTS